MKRSVIFLVAAAFILAAPGIQLAFAADDTPKVEKVGKTGSSAETKMMNKTDKTPKAKTQGNGADKAKVKTQGNGAVKAKVKTGADAKGGDDVALKKGGKTTGAVK